MCFTRSEAHYSSSLQAHQLALELFDNLCQALSKVPTSKQHQHLSDLLESAQSCLPSSITDSFSRPSYPAYPENDEYNQHAKDTLVKARTDASDVIKKGKEGVDWYMRLLNARGKVLSKHSEIKELEGDIRQLLDFLERGEDMSERPDMSSQHCLDGNFEQWIKAIPSKSAVALQYIEQSESICNRSTFLALQYRNLLKTPPRSIREQAGWETDFVNDDLADQVDIDASQLLELRQQTLAAVQIAKEDIEILDRAQQAFISALSIRNEGLSIQRQLENLIQKTAYPSPQAIQKDHDELKHTVAQLVSRIEKQVMGPFSSFESLIKIHQRQLLSLRQQLLSAISDITDLPSQLSRSMDLLERVQNQTTIVENVEAEAEKMIADVTVIREEAQQTAQREDTNNVLDSLLAKIEKLEKGAKSWESKLSQRVPFLASGTNEHLSSNDLDTIPAVPPHLTLTSSSSAPPMTPPLSRSNTPQQSSTLGVNIYGANSAGLDLASVDGSVKAAVNDQVLAVGSHIAHCKSVCRSTILSMWEYRYQEGTTGLGKGISSWLDFCEKTGSTLDDIADRIDAQSVSHDLAQVTVQEVEDILVSFKKYTTEHKKILHAQLEGMEDIFNAFHGWGEDEGSQDRCERWEISKRISKDAVEDALGKAGHIVATGEALLVKIRYQTEVTANQQQVIPDTPIPPTNTPDVLEPCVVAEDISSSILETPSNDLDLLEQLRKQLDNLQVEEIVHPITLRPTWTLTSRHLPTQKTAEHMAKILGDISGSVQSLVNSSSHVILSEAENLKQSLTSREMLMPRLEQLAQVDGAIKACDDAHSQLLDKIDHYVEQKERLEEAARDAKQALDYVLECSVPVNDDSRVRREVKRLTVTKNDLAILVEECLHPEKLKEKCVQDAVSEISRSESELSFASTVHSFNPTPSVSKLPRLSNPLFKPSSRSTSNPQHTPRRPSSHIFESQGNNGHRVVSDTPTYVLENKSQSIANLHRHRASRGSDSTHSAIPTLPDSDLRARKSSIPRRARLSNASSIVSPSVVTPQSAKAIPKLKRTRNLVPSAQLKVKEYVPNSRSKLDVAIGKVINTLDVSGVSGNERTITEQPSFTDRYPSTSGEPGHLRKQFRMARFVRTVLDWV